MDQLANDLLKMGLLGAKGQSDETGHSLAMIQRFAEAVSHGPGKSHGMPAFRPDHNRGNLL